MLDRVTLNARKPEQDEYGNAVLERMNESHYELTQWGLSHVDPKAAADILDIGCGGGRTINGFLTNTDAKVCGIDFSDASVAKTIELNKAFVEAGRASITKGTAESLPYPENSFDLVTAFETVYYWVEPTECFKKVLSTLREKGEFLVCNEDKDRSRPVVAQFADALGMTLYSAEELGGFMKAAGFTEVRTYEHENGLWVCAVGKK
ncbi:MAG: class I SAM-dependent methyltransferase [Clostridia bacterium]|nr:class I SAM-dependent methyltransferase [Clostridia bacterium]